MMLRAEISKKTNRPNYHRRSAFVAAFLGLRSSIDTVQFGRDVRHDLCERLMLPDVEHCPARRHQLVIVEPIAYDICLKL
jgi:hypothetical protein